MENVTEPIEELEKSAETELDWDMDKGPTNEEKLAMQDGIKELAVEAAKYKSQIETLEDQVSAIKALYNPILEKLQKALELLEITAMSAQGYKFTLKEETSAKIPKTIEQKKEFFAYLESIGMFYEFLGIQSATLQKLFKSQSEKALEAGVIDFQMPGIEKTTPYNVLKVKKEK